MHDRSYRLGATLFFVSGACSLVYEVTWVRVLSLELGASAVSIAGVVGSFMAGLALGAWWAGRRARTIRRPLLAFGLLELGIALCGLASPVVLGNLDLVLRPVHEGLSEHPLGLLSARFVLAFLVLLVPTSLMGASLPVLAVGLEGGRGSRFRAGALYGINTLGAGLGVLLTGFFLLPRLGVTWTLRVAVAIGFAIALASFLGQRASAPVGPVEPVPETPAPRRFVVAIGAIGAGGLLAEVAWTRLLEPVLGSSTYVFSIILATYLVGHGLGALLAGRILRSRRPLGADLGVLVALSGPALLLGLSLADSLPDLITYLADKSSDRLLLFFFGQACVCGVVALVPAVLHGLAYPLALAACRDESGGRTIGGLYAASTIGGVFGSAIGGLLLLPLLGAAGAVVLVAVVDLLVGVGLVVSEGPRPGPALRFRGIALAAVFGLIVLVRPSVDAEKLQRGVFRDLLAEQENRRSKGDLVFSEEGIGTTVAVYRSPDATSLKVGGKTDASTGSDLATQYLLGHLPLLLGAAPRRVCVIGYGSGATVHAVAGHPVESIDVAEIEPAVLSASPYFSSVNGDVLADPRVVVHLEDGRNFLDYTSDRFDLIISEPSNPWIAGVSSLFSREFYSLVSSRLAEGGLFCQWIQDYEVSTETRNVMLRTLADSFAHVAVFLVGEADLICVASQKAIVGDPLRYRVALDRAAVRRTLDRVGLTDEYDLLLSLVALFPEDVGRFETSIRNTDDNLWLEYRAPLEMYLGTSQPIDSPDCDLLRRRLVAAFFEGVPRAVFLRSLAEAVERVRPAWSGLLEVETGDPELDAELSLAAGRAASAARERLRNPERIRRFGRSLQEGNAREALDFLHQILSNDPRHPGFDRLAGQIHVEIDELEQATQHFEKALALQPLDYESQVHLAALHEAAGRPWAAENLSAAALRNNPFDVQTRVARIRFLMRSDRLDEARAVYVEGTELLDRRRVKELHQRVESIAEVQ